MVEAVFVVVRGGRAVEKRPEQAAALVELTFGAAFWVGLIVNVLCVEWYLWSVLEKRLGGKEKTVEVIIENAKGVVRVDREASHSRK